MADAIQRGRVPNPVIRIELRGEVPVYRQIALQVKAALMRGEIPAGDPLPSVRRLAIDLGVNHNTVAEAYRLLARGGWIDLHDRKGAAVVLVGPQDGSPAGLLSKRLGDAIADARREGMPDRKVVEVVRDLFAEFGLSEGR